MIRHLFLTLTFLVLLFGLTTERDFDESLQNGFDGVLKQRKSYHNKKKTC